MTRAMRWKHIRYEIRSKGIVRWGTVVLAKWLLDRALRDGHGSVDAVVLTEGGGCASFDIQKTVWNCSIPGGELTIVVDPIMAGGNCSEWSHIHRNDHRVADLVDELQARADCEDAAAHPPRVSEYPERPHFCHECGDECIGGLCDACVVRCEAF
jgi:hypothetical protein